MVKTDLSDETYGMIVRKELDISDEARLFYISLRGSPADRFIESLSYRIANAPRLLRNFVSEKVLSPARVLGLRQAK